MCGRPSQSPGADDPELDRESLPGVRVDNIEDLRQRLVPEYGQSDAAVQVPATRGQPSSDREASFRRRLLSIDKLEDHITPELLHLVSQDHLMHDTRRQLHACRH